jgi:hypothetical protein
MLDICQTQLSYFAQAVDKLLYTRDEVKSSAAHGHGVWSALPLSAEPVPVFASLVCNPLFPLERERPVSRGQTRMRRAAQCRLRACYECCEN